MTADETPWTGPILTCMADVEPVEVSWLWPGRIPLGRITLLAGRPGEGKSFLTTYIAACITNGSPWPDGAAAPLGSVILISAEDGAGDTIRPRLDAHHADVAKVHALSLVRRIDEHGQPVDSMFTLQNIVELEMALLKHLDCQLVIIDPIGSYMGGKIDGHRDNEVRSVLAPVAALAEKYGVAVLVVAHHRKSGSDFGDDMIMGSRAFSGIARASWHLVSDPQDKSRRLLLPGKNNLAAQSTGLAFTITGEPPALAWESEPLEMHIDDLMAAMSDGEGGGKLQEEKDWLRERLADGLVSAKALLQEAKDSGFSDKPIRKAFKQMGGKPVKSSFGGGWQWHLATRPEAVEAKMDEDPPF